MALPVKLWTVANEMEMVSDQITAFINRKTGELISFDAEDLVYAEDGGGESLPDWQQGSVEEAKKVQGNDDYITLPDQHDIHEYSIMERFCHSVDNERVQDALFRAIQGRGAFRYFKDQIAEHGIRDDWFAFRDATLKKIAADFLESEGFAYIEK